MNNFFRSLPLHIRSAFKSLKRNFASTISSVFAVTITLFLISIFLISAINLNYMTHRVEQSVNVAVRIDKKVAESDYGKIKAELEKIPNVKKIVFSSKEDELKRLIDSDQGGKAYSQFENDNPLLSTYYIYVSDGKALSQVCNASMNIEGVYDAGYGDEGTSGMMNLFNSVRIGGGAFVVALSALAIFLISNTIKINIQNRKEEISIMRNVGASNWFIKIPFLFEGMVIGLIGSFIPILLTIFGYGILYDAMNGQFFTNIFKIYTPMPYVIILSFTLLVIGVLVGLIGSFVSVNKYLKWKR